MKRVLLTAVAAVAFSLGAAQDSGAAETASARLLNLDRDPVGTVELTETPNGVLLKVRLEDLPPGAHAFHIHETGTCEPPFKSAGGHFNPENKKHGMLSEQGMHAGDLPNIHMPEGVLQLEILAEHVSLAEGADNGLFDEDGSAIVIHDGPDDYSSDPAGAAGDRIACGVIE